MLLAQAHAHDRLNLAGCIVRFVERLSAAVILESDHVTAPVALHHGGVPFLLVVIDAEVNATRQNKRRHALVEETVFPIALHDAGGFVPADGFQSLPLTCFRFLHHIKKRQGMSVSVVKETLSINIQ